MERLLTQLDCDPKRLSPLTLAFIGDTVYDLFVREALICEANRPAKALHNCAVEQVRASAQARAVRIVRPLLTQEESELLRRGRNARSGHTPKNASESDYHHATGLEALFGYLYLLGRIDRLRELFAFIQSDETPGNEACI